MSNGRLDAELGVEGRGSRYQGARWEWGTWSWVSSFVALLLHDVMCAAERRRFRASVRQHRVDERRERRQLRPLLRPSVRPAKQAGSVGWAC